MEASGSRPYDKHLCNISHLSPPFLSPAMHLSTPPRPPSPPWWRARTGVSCMSTAPMAAPSGGASTSPSSTRLRRPSTSCPLSRHHLVTPYSASLLSAWSSKALLTSCWARWMHGSSASLVSCCRSSLARRGYVVRAAPRPWIRMAFCSSPCHHPRSSSKRGHIGTR